MRIALLGYGTVGQGVMALYQERREALEEALGEPITFVGIGVRSLDRPREIAADPALFTTDVRALALDDVVDVVLEVTGNVGAMGDVVEDALRAGKSVVTANKALLAARLVSLSHAAAEGHAVLRFEAAAGGAMPVVNVLQQQTSVNRVTSLQGILNGSSNYVLTELSKARLRDDVLREARALGVLEADPTDDLAGFDARNKITLLASLALHAVVPVDSVACIGIQDITEDDLAYFARRGQRVKLIAVFSQTSVETSTAPRVRLSVMPTAFTHASAFAHVNGIENAAVLACEKAGELTLKGVGGGMEPTANAVWTDVLRVRTDAAFPAWEAFDADAIDTAQESFYYLRAQGEQPLSLTADESARARVLDERRGVLWLRLNQARAVALYRDGAVVIRGGEA